MPNVRIYAVVTISAILLLGGAGCGTTSTSPAAAPASAAPAPSYSDATNAALNDLDSKCAGDLAHVTDQVRATQLVMQNDGYPESFQTVAVNMDRSMPASLGPNFDCAQIGAAYAVLVEHPSG